MGNAITVSFISDGPTINSILPTKTQRGNTKRQPKEETQRENTKRELKEGTQ